jgi:hypothetical protein
MTPAVSLNAGVTIIGHCGDTQQLRKTDGFRGGGKSAVFRLKSLLFLAKNVSFFEKIQIFSGHSEKSGIFTKNQSNGAVIGPYSFDIVEVYESGLFYQIYNIVNAEFVHNITAVTLNRTHGPAEYIGHFLITLSFKDHL